MADLAAKDGTTALDLDGIVVSIVSEEDVLTLFAKSPESTTYVIARRTFEQKNLEDTLVTSV